MAFRSAWVKLVNTLRGMTILVNSWVMGKLDCVNMELPRFPVLVPVAGVRVRWGERMVRVPLNTVLPKALFPVLSEIPKCTQTDRLHPLYPRIRHLARFILDTGKYSAENEDCMSKELLNKDIYQPSFASRLTGIPASTIKRWQSGEDTYA